MLIACHRGGRAFIVARKSGAHTAQLGDWGRWTQEMVNTLILLSICRPHLPSKKRGMAF